MDIRVIQEKIRLGDYRLSEHAGKRMVERTIDRIEVEEAIYDGVVIERIPMINIHPVV